MRRQLLLCAGACFLLSAFLMGCQTTHKANHNDRDTAKTSGKDGADKDKTGSAHKNITGSSKYYAAHKKPIKAAPTVAVPAVTNVPPAQQVTTDNARIVSTLNTQPVTTDNKLIAGNTTQVTIIIKDSVASGDTTMAMEAIAKPDTIQFKETSRDDAGEPDQATNEEPLPLSPEEMDTVLSKYAEMINIDRSEISNFNLYFFIDEWYGTPYKWGGTDSSGIDCSAFCQKLYGKVYGVDILRTAREQRKHAEHIKYPDETNEGDLVFFRIHHLRVSHVGVYLANGYFVHSSRSKGVVISNLNNKYWHRRFAGCGRIPREERSLLESDFAQ